MLPTNDSSHNVDASIFNCDSAMPEQAELAYFSQRVAFSRCDFDVIQSSFDLFANSNS